MGGVTGTVVGCIVLIAALAGTSAKAQDIDATLRACLVRATSKEMMDRRFESCSAFIEQASGSPAKRAIAFASRGWVQVTRRDYPKAIADFDSALSLNSNFDWALAGRAVAFLNSRQSERAIPDFDRVIAMHPSSPQLYIGRGDAYNNLKQYDRGIADFDRALALDPNNDEAMNDRAWALARKGQYAEAIQGYDAAFMVATGRRALVLGNRCETKAMAGQIDAALADCEAALEIEPGNSSYLFSRGFANLMGERFVTAIADYDAALAADPKNAFALYGRGVARLWLGQSASGRDDIAAAAQIRPGIREDMSALGVKLPGDPR